MISSYYAVFILARFQYSDSFFLDFVYYVLARMPSLRHLRLLNSRFGRFDQLQSTIAHHTLTGEWGRVLEQWEGVGLRLRKLWCPIGFSFSGYSRGLIFL